MDEFDLIATYFRPLSKGFAGSLSLSDDCAFLQAEPGIQLATTVDTMVAGVHFIGNEDPALIARKLLRVNLSDLASAGAKPQCYLLALTMPSTTDEAWVARFAEGLREDQEAFGIHLAGGDTTSTEGPLTLTLTAFGQVKENKGLHRSGAKPGDVVYVTGEIGNATIGLKLLSGNTSLEREELSEYLKACYLLPMPRLAVGAALTDIASSCMDVSDGLVQDLGHICKASGTSAILEAPKMPLSEAAQLCIASNIATLGELLSGGDDYELLFTVPRDRESLLPAIAEATGVKLTPIGRIEAGSGVTVMDDHGWPVPMRHEGFRHFRKQA